MRCFGSSGLEALVLPAPFPLSVVTGNGSSGQKVKRKGRSKGLSRSQNEYAFSRRDPGSWSNSKNEKNENATEEDGMS